GAPACGTSLCRPLRAASPCNSAVLPNCLPAGEGKESNPRTWICGPLRGTRTKKRRLAAPFRNDCILRHDDACETTLNPGFKWGRWGTIGLPAARRTCTPGTVAPPWSSLRDKANVCTRRRSRQRTHRQYSHVG